LSLTNELIFISIASYRDSQLVPTVKDLLLKAQEPALLRFGICWQHDAQDEPLPFLDDAQFRVLDVDWRDSRGACWARAQVMQLWRGEQYFLQLDSHCRFAPAWDTKLIRMMQQTGSPKPILSTYAYPFTPVQPGCPGFEDLSGEAQLMAIETFTAEGLPQLKPMGIPGLAQRTGPVPARFLAAGFLFAPGEFVQDVPYDPELYFFGEEISMTLRAFTAGYDLFHPVEQIVWHDYVRSYAIRHWDNHAAPAVGNGAPAAPTFHDLDRISRAKIVQLLGCAGQQSGETQAGLAGPGDGALGSFGLGSERTLEDYETYAGLSFGRRKIQDYTRCAYDPPNPPAPEDWADRIYNWLVRIVLEPETLPAAAFEDTGFWVVALQDGNAREIHRRDWTPAQLEEITDFSARNVLITEMESGMIPVTWSIWPFSRSRG
jgi:hypothetical protein